MSFIKIWRSKTGFSPELQFLELKKLAFTVGKINNKFEICFTNLVWKHMCT